MKKILAVFLMVMLLTGTALAVGAPDSAATAESSCPHATTEMVITQPATCEEPGYATFVCADCGETIGYSYIPPTGHSYQDTVTPATCTEQGYTTHVCEVCGASYVDAYTEPTGHQYVDVVTPATCMEQGYTTHTCQACGDSYVDSYVEPSGHSYVYQYDADVVYDEAGNIIGYNSYGTWMCEYCGDVVAASEGNAIYYIGPVVAATEAAAADAGSAGPQISDGGWATIEIIMVIVLVVETIVLMLSFGKKKPEESAAQ